MKYKAKTYNGEWVEGYYIAPNAMYCEDCSSVSFGGNGDQQAIGLDVYLIEPSTLCQQVRGTEFFEGDILLVDISDISRIKEPFEAELYWETDLTLFFGWGLRNIKTGTVMRFDIAVYTTTGRNKHD